MTELVIVLLLLLFLLVALILFLLNRRNKVDLKAHLPYVLLIAFRERDTRARRHVAKIQKDLLVKLDRNYTLQPSSILELVLDTVDQTGKAYFPEVKYPVKQLTMKQLNDLTGRIVASLNQLFATFPFSLATSIDVATVQTIRDGARAIKDSAIVRGIMDSPVGPVLRKIPFLKIGNAIRIGRKVMTPMGVVLETGRQIGMESFKRLLLREVTGIVSRESTRTFSGGEVFEDEQRATLIALWLAADSTEKEPEYKDELARWITRTVVKMKNRPDTLTRFLLARVTGSSTDNNGAEREIIARYRQAAGRLEKDQRRIPPEWQMVFEGKSFSAINDLGPSDDFRKLIESFSPVLPEKSVIRHRFEKLIHELD